MQDHIHVGSMLMLTRPRPSGLQGRLIPLHPIWLGFAINIISTLRFSGFPFAVGATFVG